MSLVTIEPVLFFYVFGAALQQPLLLQYIYKELSGKYNFTKGEETTLCENGTDKHDNATSLENLVQTEASHWFLILSLCTCLPSVVATLLFGPMSDTMGRKPMLLLAVTGAFLKVLVVAVTATFGFPFYAVFLGSFIEGLTGSLASILGSCMAYIFDITNKESRSLKLGIMQAVLAVAATTSFLVGGFWLSSSGYKAPFWASVGMLFFCMLYVAFFLPESLQSREPHTGISCLAPLKRIRDFAITKRGPQVNICLLLVFIAFLFSVFDFFGNVTVIYVKHYPLCWDSKLIGYYMATITGAASIGTFVGLKIVGRVFSENMLVVISCLLLMISNIVTGFAHTTAVMFFSCLPLLICCVASPCIRSIATLLVEKHEQGTLASILGVTEALAQVLAPLSVNLLYPVGIKKLHVAGFVFFFQSAILLIPILIFMVIHHMTHKNKAILNENLREEVSRLVQA